MAPATPFQKIKKAAGNHQRARGAWSSAFPDLKKQQQKTLSTKVIKIKSRPSKAFWSAEALLADFYEQSTTTQAQEKLTEPARKDEGFARVSQLATAAESSKNDTTCRDSLSPLPTAPKPKRTVQRAGSGLSFTSSSSSATTSVRGVHLLLAIILPIYHDRWFEDWKDLCNLTGDQIEPYYSSIETITDPAGLKIYADCENKVMGDMLKNKLRGHKILNKNLIREFI